MGCYQDELPALAKSAVEVSFHKDKAIIKQGDEGHRDPWQVQNQFDDKIDTYV